MNEATQSTESDELRRIAELEQAIEKMYRQLDAGGVFESDRRSNSGCGDWRDNRWETGRRQSGIGRENICSRCGTRNEPEVLYCGRCGTRIVRG